MKSIPIRIISTQEADLLQVRFFPTDICNYKCSYCFAGLTQQNRYPKDTDLVVKNFRRIFDYYKLRHNKKKFEVTISGGGEPTLWPEIERFCCELKELHNVKIVLVSNGSRTLRWWDDNSKYFDDVVLSCHHEFVDLPHYIHVADTLYKHGVNVIAFNLMDARYWDKCVNQVNQMQQSQYPWFIEVKPIVGEAGIGMGMDVYNEEQLEYLHNTIKRLPDSDWILKRLNTMKLHESVVLFENNSAELATSHTLIVNKWNHFNGWLCNVATEAIAIGPDGTLTGSCRVPLFNENFNIYSVDFTDKFSDALDLKQLTCPYESCNCGTDTHITKSASTAK